MSRIDTAVLAIRLAALYAWFQALEFLTSGVITLFFRQTEAFGSLSIFASLAFVLPSVAFLVAGIFLFFRAPRLADKFLSSDDAPSDSALSSGIQTPSVAFGVAGLAAVLYALPRAVSTCISLLQSDQFQHDNSQAEFIRMLPHITANTLPLILGLVLVIRAGSFARWWQHKQRVSTHEV